jgi:hypothetical protein
MIKVDIKNQTWQSFGDRGSSQVACSMFSCASMRCALFVVLRPNPLGLDDGCKLHNALLTTGLICSNDPVSWRVGLGFLPK